MTDRSSPPRILIADDDPIIRTLLSEVLESNGATVTAVADGRAAVEAARMRPYDACVLDVEMPVKSGLEACREMRAMAFTRHLPILMLTGLTDEATINAAFAAGAGDFLNKPVHAVLLWRRLCNLIELKKLQDCSEHFVALKEFAEPQKAPDVTFQP